MSKLLANGQLPAAKGTLFTATGPDVVNINLANTSAVSTETVILYVGRNAGTDRIVRQVILSPNESALLTGLPIESGDLIKGQSTDATTVDYDITGQGQAAQSALPPPAMVFQAFDSSGRSKFATGTSISSATTIATASSTAFVVGPNGTTNPTLQIDTSTASSATGIKVKSAAAAGGVAVSVVSSGTNEALTIDAKGSGAITLGGTSTGIISLGRGSVSMPIFSSTKTTVSAQNSTPTAAQLIGGYIDHNSQTGAGTATLDTAANIDAAITGVANGDSFQCVYVNRGNQTVTITTNTGLTLRGTAALPSGKNAILDFFRTGAAAWDVAITISA